MNDSGLNGTGADGTGATDSGSTDSGSTESGPTGSGSGSTGTGATGTGATDSRSTDSGFAGSDSTVTGSGPTTDSGATDFGSHSADSTDSGPTGSGSTRTGSTDSGSNGNSALESGSARSEAPRSETSEPETSAPETAGPETAGPETAEPGEPLGPTEWGNTVGVGPWEGPWPDDERYDPELLAGGDRRNVVDQYRYWRRAAIVADLDARRHEFHIAIENFQHDHNIGTVVRTANAFLASAVHIVGRRRWNRRGAMVTDRYQHVHHHPDIAALGEYAAENGLAVVAVDNTPGARPIERTALPRRCVLLFGQEGPGLHDESRRIADQVVSIAQFGSTRSINAGVAAGVVMHTWVAQHAHLESAW